MDVICEEREARAVIRICLIAALVAGSGISQFQGPSRLAASIKDGKTALLIYSSNGNDVGVLTRGAVLPLDLKTQFWSQGNCCLHQAIPSLSPDGGRIAYVRLASTKPRQETINIYDRATSKEQEIFQSEVIWGVSWEPRGDRLAVVADKASEPGHNLYLVDVASNSVSQVTHGQIKLADRTYTVSNHGPPSWNSAGSQLAMELRIAGEQAENSTSSIIVLLNLETNEFVRLSEGVDPAWSPAQDAIAFFEPSRKKCFTIKSDGREKKLLFALGERGFPSRSALLLFPVVWSPDGRELLFHQWVDADLITDVYRLDLGRGKPRFLSRSEVQVVNWRETKQ